MKLQKRFKTAIRRKIIDFGLSNFTTSQTELIRQTTTVLFNQVQFSATHFEPMVDGSFDYMQTNGIRPMSWNPLGSVFRRQFTNPTHEKITCNFSIKIPPRI
jgi:predicted oxidoreductase